MKTTALLFTGIDRVEIADAHIPEPGPGQVLVEALYTAVSPGTEMRCLAGKQLNATFPFIPGYSMVGRIAARGQDVMLAEGTIVFCGGTEKADHPLLWGAHVAHAMCGADRVVALPPGVDPLEASLTKLAAIAYRGVRVANTRPHDEVAIVGLGPIGQLAARLHVLAGARIVAADLDPTRVALARSAGIEAVTPTSGLVSTLQSLQPQGADVVVDSTGAVAVLQQSIQLARLKAWDDSLTEPARLVIQGSYAENVVFDYHQAFFRELAVHFPRDNQRRDVLAVLGFLATRRLKIRDLVTRIVQPADAPQIYAALRRGEPGLLTAAFQWHKMPVASPPSP